MTASQARAYFEQFMSEMNESRERLAATLQEQGADPGLVYDLTPQSLDPMWRALTPVLAWQNGWEPNPSGLPRPTLEALGDLDALPSWVATVGGPIQFSPPTIWIIDGVGRHLGNVMSASVPGTRWSIGHHRIRAYVHQNMPVITAPETADLDPFEMVSVIASKTLRGVFATSERSPWDRYVAIAAQAQAEAGVPTPQKSPEPASPAVTGCTCGEHVVEVAEQVVPFAASSEAEDSGDSPMTVADLVEAEALGAEEVEDEPGRWQLWFGDETRAHYDDDAPMSLEDVVAMAPGVSDVVREDRETILVRGAGRCEDAMVAVAARALLDDRVRRTRT